jgi:hypothetical protein
MYALRQASQGEPMYLREAKYLKEKAYSTKALHHKVRRIGWQESSALNNLRRIIAAPVSKGVYCNHKINYIPEGASKLSLDFVLALLNSSISDWFFRLQSTNAAVSHYQVLELPLPTIQDDDNRTCSCNSRVGSKRSPAVAEQLCAAIAEPGVMATWIVEEIAGLSREIQKIESQRVLKMRSERSRLASDSQTIQDSIDRVLFHSLGLGAEDGRYIQERLREML